MNQSLDEDTNKAAARPFKLWGPTPTDAPTTQSEKEEATTREEKISAAQKQHLIEDLLNSVTSGSSNINWGEILQKTVTKSEDFGAVGAAEATEKPKKKKKGKKSKKTKKAPAAAEGSSDVDNNPQ